MALVICKACEYPYNRKFFSRDSKGNKISGCWCCPKCKSARYRFA